MATATRTLSPAVTGKGVRPADSPAPAAADTDRRVRCRYLRGRGNFTDRCTAVVAEEGAEIELCLEHLGAAMAMVNRRLSAVRGGR